MLGVILFAKDIHRTHVGFLTRLQLGFYYLTRVRLEAIKLIPKLKQRL